MPLQVPKRQFCLQPPFSPSAPYLDASRSPVISRLLLHKYSFPLLPPCSLPASTDPGIFAAQRTLVEAWTIVGQAFVDASFNGHDWEGELREHMMTAFNAPSPDDAFGEIGHLLEDLGDPYTRRVPPE